MGNAQINDAKIREAQKEKRRQAYHNTQLLLRNYRNIIWQAECEVSRIAEELDTPLKDFDAVLTRVDAEIGMGNRKPEAKLSSLTKFRLLIDRVNEALTLLRKKPDNGERLYQLIYAAYIAPEKQDVDTILERMELSRRHFYRLREQAITVLSIRLWAAPTSDLDMWLDLVALLLRYGRIQRIERKCMPCPKSISRYGSFLRGQCRRRASDFTKTRKFFRENVCKNDHFSAFRKYSSFEERKISEIHSFFAGAETGFPTKRAVPLS